MTTLFCAQYWGTDTSSFHLYLHLYYCNNFWTRLLYRLYTTTTVINDLKYTKCLFCQAVLLGAEDTVMESDTTPAFKELRLVQEKEKTNHVISDSKSATKTLPQSKNKKKKQGKRQGLSEVTSTWHLTSDSLTPCTSTVLRMVYWKSHVHLEAASTTSKYSIIYEKWLYVV